jgi:ABC-type branched-subunit amino acid transport system substrate-binding protein
MLADNWKEKRKVRILAVNLEIGERCIRGASTVLPGLQVERFNGGDDLRSIVTRIRASDTDGLIFAGYEPDARTLLKLMAEMRLQIDLAGTHGDLPTIEPPQEYLSILKNTTVFGFKSVSPQFLKRFQKEFPDAPSLGIEAAAMSYLHVQQLAKAMSKCGKKDISCQVSDLNDQPADLAISFTGWEKRAAKYEMRLKRYDGLKFADLAAR